MPDRPVEKVTFLSKETAIPLGVATVVLIGVVGIMLDLTRELMDIEYSIADNSRSIHTLRVEMQREFDDMDKGMADRWHRRDMIEWVERFRLSNDPGLVIPEIPSFR